MCDDGNFIQMILNVDPTPIKQRNLGVHNALAELIDYALGDWDDLHYISAKEFKKDLIEVTEKLEL
jgi:hypothetical protein